MNTFAEFKEFVKKKGYGSFQFNTINGEPVYLSRGIRELFFENEEEEQKLYDMVRRFQSGDFGDAAAHGKEAKAGHEYGRYAETSFEETQEDTAVWIHRMEAAVKVYFTFER